MENYILEMRNIRKTFLGGKVVANDDVTLKIKKGEKIAEIYYNNDKNLENSKKMLLDAYVITDGKVASQKAIFEIIE